MKNKIFFTRKLKLIFSLLFLFFIACDPEGKKKCQWVLEPENHKRYKPLKGFITVCARNRKTMKQDCRLQTKIEKAKSWSGKKFRYTDLETESVIIPRTIKSIKFCSS
jgi:hypothetical protein